MSEKERNFTFAWFDKEAQNWITMLSAVHILSPYFAGDRNAKDVIFERLRDGFLHIKFRGCRSYPNTGRITYLKSLPRKIRNSFIDKLENENYLCETMKEWTSDRFNWEISRKFWEWEERTIVILEGMKEFDIDYNYDYEEDGCGSVRLFYDVFLSEQEIRDIIVNDGGQYSRYDPNSNKKDFVKNNIVGLITKEKKFNIQPIIDKLTVEAASGELELRVGSVDVHGVRGVIVREIFDRISQEIALDAEMPSEITVRRRVARIADIAKSARKK